MKINIKSTEKNLRPQKTITSFLLLFICFFIPTLSRAQHTIKGTVSNTEGEKIPGVNILLKGTSTGTITDQDGQYNLEVPEPRGTLIFKFVGYKTIEVPINNRSTINIEMEIKEEELSEVVVIGYGVQKKSDLTGAITQVKTREIKETASIGIDQALQGRAAGVQITQNSGMPGSGVMVQIRGMGTWNDSDPLFVVDGVPMEENVSSLNPADIASIEVLKDASAAAIYGARAANGVVLISTKQGKSGHMQVSLDYYSAVQQPWQMIDMCDAIEYGNTYNYIRETQGRDPDNPMQWERFFITENLDSIGEGTNWQEEIFRQAPMHSVNLSITGGSEKSTYALSANQYNQQGIIKSSAYKRTSFRINSTHKPAKWLRIGENLSMSMAKANEVKRGKGNTSTKLALLSDPIANVYRSKEDSLYGEYSKWAPVEYSINPNPIGILDRLDNERIKNTILGNIFIEIEPINDLVFRSSAGTNILFHEFSNFNPTFFESGSTQSTLNTLTRHYWQNSSWLWENTLSYSRTFNKHNLNFLLGYSMQKRKLENYSAKKNDFPNNNELYRFFNLANEVTNPADIRGGYTASAMLSYLGRINYTYNDKYLLTASIRRDGSSRFGPDSKPNFGNKARFDYFPSFALGWKISEENFFSNLNDVINFMKVRIGWGQIGNDKMGSIDFPYVTAVETNTNLQNYVFDNQQTTGAAIVGKANTSVKWEVSQQSNIGLDMNFWENQLTFTADFYKKNTKDQLVRLNLPHIVGVFNNPVDLNLGGDPQVNAGEVENKGFEFIITYRQKKKSFKYEFSINLTRNINEVISLSQGVEPIYAGQVQGAYVSRTDAGLPIASFYGFETDGLFTAADDTDNDGIVDNQPVSKDESGHMVLMQPYAAPGDVKFVDQNNDGVLDVDDKIMTGSPHPDFFAGFTVRLEYKGFDMMMFWQGVYGNDIFNTLNYDWMGGGISSNFHTDILDAYRLPSENHKGNTETTVPRLDGNQSNGNYTNISDLYIEDGSYLRLKNTQLGYTLPAKFISKIKINTVRVYIGAQNLFTFTRYRGYDPEIGRAYNDYGLEQDFDNTQALEMGIDWGNYPQARTYIFGLNISF